MGNFEKLSVLVIVVIIVMILVVAIYEWTGSPSDAANSTEQVASKVIEPLPTPLPTPDPFRTPAPTPGPGLGGKEPIAKIVTPPSDPWWDPNKLIPEETPRVDPKVDGKDPKDGKDGAASKDGVVTPPDATPAAIEFAETTHVVVRGDTLSGIAQKYWQKGSLFPRIEEANPGVTARDLREGMKLKIPAMKIEARKASAIPAASGGAAGASTGDGPVPGKEYKVKPSDTWERISKEAYKTSERWPEIYVKNMKLTPSPRDLRGGLVLMIPR